MASYRDDTQETAVAGSEVFIGLKTLAEESARIEDRNLFGLLLVQEASARVEGTAIDRMGLLVVESALASDAALHHLSAADTTEERARALDEQRSAARVWHEDDFVLSDAVEERVRSATIEWAAVSDEALCSRRVRGLVVEMVTGRDVSFALMRDVANDGLNAVDTTLARLRAADRATEELEALDEAFGARKSTVLSSDGALISSWSGGHLRAASVSEETGVIDDEPIQIGAWSGQAWTANTETWAMSRWNPVRFDGLTVVNGTLYGLADDGVYAVDALEPQAGMLQTAPLDVGQGQLTHPLQAVVEYEMEDGSAFMDVTSTQSGTAATYSYPLAPENSNELTNGRFIFGRGLRGRHFSFTLRMNARRGHINDLSVQTAPTKRRV